MVEHLHVDYPGGYCESQLSYTNRDLTSPGGTAFISVHIDGEPSDSDPLDFDQTWRNLSDTILWPEEGPTLLDLWSDLDRVEGLETYSLEELRVLVGPAWGYNVTKTGTVSIGAEQFDLAGAWSWTRSQGWGQPGSYQNGSVGALS